MDMAYLIFGVLLFLTVVLAVEGLYLMWAARHSTEARRLAARLRYLEGAPEEAPDARRQDLERHWKWLESQVLAPLPLGRWLLDHVRSAGTGRSAGELLALSAALGLGGTLLGTFLRWNWTPALAAGTTAAALPWLWLRHQRSARLRRLEQQLPLALDLMSRALRAGHALPTAMRMVGEEMSDPMAREFRQLADENNFGMGLPEAMVRLGQRVPMEDINYFVTAVLIQRETGGNLAELLDNIAAIVRARLKLMGQVRTFSAEGRISAWILGLLPFGAGAVLYQVNPEFMAFLWTDPQGLRLSYFALGAMVVGVLWMRRIIRIRV